MINIALVIVLMGVLSCDSNEVVRYLNEHPTQKQVRMTLPMAHAIFSTLQASQNPEI